MKRFICFLFLAGLAATSSASAQTITGNTATVTVQAAGLEMTGPNSLVLDFASSPTIDYDNPTTVSGSTWTGGTATFSVQDRRAGDSGWSITMQASDFARSGGGTAIPASNFSYIGAAGRVTRQAGPPPTTAPNEIVATHTLNSAAKVVSATAGNGKGKYDWNPAPTAFRLTVPAGTLEGTYTSDLTLTIVSTP